jgi:hypothetical protein
MEGERVRNTVWITLAIDLLRNIEAKKAAYANITKRLEWLNEQYERIKGPVLDTTPVQGGALNREEDRRLDNLAEREELEITADLLKHEIEAYERAWGQLGKQFQQVLTYFFVSRPRDHVDKLKELLHCEKTDVYRKKDDALCEFARRRYGKF